MPTSCCVLQLLARFSHQSIITRILGSLTQQEVQRVPCHHHSSWQVIAVVRIWLGWQKRKRPRPLWRPMNDGYINQNIQLFSLQHYRLCLFNSLSLTHYYILLKWSSPSLFSPLLLLWKVSRSQECAIHLPVLPHWHTSVVWQMTQSRHWPLALLPRMRRRENLVQ